MIYLVAGEAWVSLIWELRDGLLGWRTRQSGRQRKEVKMRLLTWALKPPAQLI